MTQKYEQFENVTFADRLELSAIVGSSRSNDNGWLVGIQTGIGTNSLQANV